MGRAPCCDKAKVKRGPWSPEEDETLKSYVQEYGTGGNWIALPHKAGLKRCGKSCRLRWLNYLRPHIKHGGFTEEEDNIIISLYATIGSRWSTIASNLSGRTDNDVKNYWNTKLKKKLFGSGGSSKNHLSITKTHNHVGINYAPNSNPRSNIPIHDSSSNSPTYTPSFPIDDDQLHFPSSSTFPTQNALLKSFPHVSHNLTTSDNSSHSHPVLHQSQFSPPAHWRQATAGSSSQEAFRTISRSLLPPSSHAGYHKNNYQQFSSVEDDVLLEDFAFNFAYDHHGNFDFCSQDEVSDYCLGDGQDEIKSQGLCQSVANLY
ncbi:hypothetical protein Nepgr_008801 [Nepenthes gracilis]|uniref:Uncharacterized protein n=1 Tax=Nepenthes gracilis TaxID=150966 RepID=A0AAD3XJT3_NEPGR|nr:hypothetical protein Nepgr_008801 [Nepenthes gracilis]